jgi:hypothetical protein
MAAAPQAMRLADDSLTIHIPDVVASIKKRSENDG